MRVSGKCQMGSAWYVREPHRIVCKYNARPFRYEASQQLFGPSALRTGIRNTYEVNRMIFDLHAPAFVIKDGDGMRAAVRLQFPAPRRGNHDFLGRRIVRNAHPAARAPQLSPWVALDQPRTAAC